MRLNTLKVILLLCILGIFKANTQPLAKEDTQNMYNKQNTVHTASFVSPDTVCVSTPFTITNTSINASTYLWNFCVPDLNSNIPQGVNLGNLGGILSQPSFMDYVNDNGNYYGFSCNYFPGKLVRLDFGTSLLNTPSVTDLGNFGGIIPTGPGAEGIQVIKDAGNWYAIIVGGSPVGGSTPRIIRIALGASITNNAPVGTLWGNIGNLAQPLDFMMFQENNGWYGITVNSENNTITRFNFTAGFTNPPTGVNLGNIGNLSYPTGLHILRDNGGILRVFVTNGGDATTGLTASVTRLDFGNSLLNTPTGMNLGNFGGLLKQTRDITIVYSCDQIFGYVVNGASSDVVKLNFNNNLTSVPTASSLGNIGNMSFPVSISKQFRIGTDIYTFVCNVNNNTITRLKLPGCSNSSMNGSNLQSPAPISYNTPGTYNINLLVDEGLITQSFFCKKVVALSKPTVSTRLDTTICKGASITLNTIASNATSYSWSPSVGLSNNNIASPIASPTVNTTYIVTAKNGYCEISDTVVVNVNNNCSSISNIINSYTPVTSLLPCENKISVVDGSTFNTGDTVLIIQMKGAEIDSTNTANFGTVTGYKNAGNYEFNYIKSKIGNVIELKNQLLRQYSIPDGKVQLIRVPSYNSVTISASLTCLPWDGTKGGILAFNVKDTLVMNADIDVSGKGFKGGGGVHGSTSSLNCFENQFYYPAIPSSASEKGEGIYNLGPSKIYGKGKNTNGGGGGNSHNSGGGGGSNAGLGGLGGYQYELSDCSAGTVPFDNRGIGGQPLTYNNTLNKVFLGGGAGSGQANNPELFYPKGGNGGGIVFITTNFLQGNSKSILAQGENAASCALSGTGCHEGMGGGGGGGTLLFNVSQTLGAVTCNVSGGKGGDMIIGGNGRLGPGGGGGGGLVWNKLGTLPGVTLNVAGGINGKATSYANDPWGSTAGASGTSINSLLLQTSTIPFKKNIDSLRMQDTLSGCRTYKFGGLAYVNSAAVASWQWDFGDNQTANTQNATHIYANQNTYQVKLIVTDINGCKDSISKTLTTLACTGISNIINDYTPVISFLPCENKMQVEDGSAFHAGDTVLIIQMKGAVVDSTNTSNFGTVTNYKNAGNYEFNYVKSVIGNIVELKNVVIRQYDLPDGRVQLIRVPYFYSTTITSTLTCLPWDGRKGGVLVFNVRDTLVMAANMDVTGKGFRGGQVVNTNLQLQDCNMNDFYYPFNTVNAAPKGESFALISNLRSYGKGNIAGGGGGGNGHNSGGGGGGNGVSGGFGGYQYSGCNASSTFDNRGIGGTGAPYSNIQNKIFLGSGGGAGQSNNGYINLTANLNFSGANGGGIIIVNSNYIRSNGFAFVSSGDEPYSTSNNGPEAHDARGGGGAGGTILATIGTYLDNAKLTTPGGKGGDLNTPSIYSKVGPGGGGAGGVVWLSQPNQPGLVTSTLIGGVNGKVLYDNTAYGTTSGATGINLTNLSTPISIIPFKKNIDSVRIKDTLNGCSIYHFGGISYVTTAPVVSWQWNFGDNQTANTQNTIHPYTAAGTYQVKLVVTDANGCKDSIIKAVTVTPSNNFDFSFKIDICNPLQVRFFDAGANSQNPYWSFGDGTSATGTTSPVHVFSSYGNYDIKYTISNGGCIDTIRKNINIQNVWSNVVLTNDTTICQGASKQLIASNSSEFCWNPITYLDNPNISNPITTTPQTITYRYTKKELGTNLVSNSNFSAGNTGFTSAYTYVTTSTGAGQYFVGPSAPAWYSGFGPCTADHTTGTGNMMLINGASTPGAKVWEQSFNVQPNTNYEVSCWVENLISLSSSKLQFSINNLPIGDTLRTTTPSCTWKQFSYTWNSGNVTFVNLSISNISDASGTGFALDDILFAPVNIYHDSVIITVDSPRVQASADTSICINSSVQIFASGASSYLWTPAAGLSNTTAPSPIANPSVATQYIVTGTTTAGCTAKDTVNVSLKPGTNFDFSYKQDICNPLIVQFDDLNIGSVNPYWDFGDGSNISGVANTTHTYSIAGNYLVKYYISNAGCVDTVRKIITVGIVPDDIITTHDTTICFGNTKKLLTRPSLGFCWTPTTYLDNPNLANPTTSTPQDITYHFTAEMMGSNVITNGDFGLGATGFTSQYNFANPNTTEGQYYVGTNSAIWNAGLSSCGDHTTASGNMMLVNGASIADVAVWKQTVTVTPNTNYAFSTWVEAFAPQNPAQLRFSINGKDIGSLITASLPTCTWTQFYTTWNSGNSTSAVIAIVNKNTAILGNDFGLDDISFAPVTIKRDSVTIFVERPTVKTNVDTTICSGNPLQITSTGALAYSWLPPTGLSNAGIANPVASPLISTQYIVTGTSANNCIAKDTLNVSILQKPSISTSPDTTICLNTSTQLSASGGTAYQWMPAVSLDNSNIPNPTANPSITTTYVVIVTGANTCINKDSVIVSVSPPKVFSIDAVQPICLNDTAQLSAHGGDKYLWSPTGGLLGTSLSNPLAFPSQNTTYTVAITDVACNRTQTLTVDLSVRPLPTITANSLNPIDCNVSSSKLSATGAIMYAWLPTSNLNNPNSSNPIASPDTTTIYLVKGTDAFGCSNIDTAMVWVKYDANAKYYLPNAFTPNNDGMNDCFGVRHWGNVTNLQFAIYNRWGQKVFETTNPNDCWDGRYKQELQQSGNFIYIVKAKTACGKVDLYGSVLLIR